MMMHLVAAFAEFERALLRERTRAGLDAASEEGRPGGRRPNLTPQQQAEIRKMPPGKPLPFPGTRKPALRGVQVRAQELSGIAA